MATGGGEVSGSDSYRAAQTRHCQPCESDGDTVTAVGYCRDCQELLCQRCYDAHCIPRKMRKHELVGLEDIDDIQPSNRDSEAKCQQHEEETVKYHCPSHAFLGCHICIFQHHKACQGVRYIPDVAKDIPNTEEYQQFNSRLADITAQCQDLVSRVAECRKTVTESHADATAAFRAHKKDILDALDRLEQQFFDNADAFKQEETVRIAALSEKLDGLLTENQRLSSTLELLQNQRRYCDLYTTMTESQDKLLDLEKDVKGVICEIREKKMQFNVDMGVLVSLKRPFGLGSLQVTGGDWRIQKLEHVGDINVRCSSDNTTCRITSSVLISKNKLVLTDCDNKKVKLCDPSVGKVVSELGIGGQPFSACKVSDSQVVVSLYTNKVALVTLGPRLSFEREISVSDNTGGMGYCDGKLVVGYHSPTQKLEILDMQGKVLKVIEKDDHGQALFNTPFHLCINPNSQHVYVSNFSKGEVLCLRLDGTVVGRYTDNDLRHPYQVIVDRGGTVYVCDQDSHNVHQVTADCEKVRLLLTQADGLNDPESISYDEDDGKVYIGQCSNDNIKVYKVTCEDVK